MVSPVMPAASAPALATGARLTAGGGGGATGGGGFAPSSLFLQAASSSRLTRASAFRVFMGRSNSRLGDGAEMTARTAHRSHNEKWIAAVLLLITVIARLAPGSSPAGTAIVAYNAAWH